MDWIRKNKFLAGFLAALVVGVGGLGYLVYTQNDAYEQTSQEYDAAAKDLERLQGLKPYPYQKSKTELIALRAETAARVTDLQKRLADYEPPAERADFKSIEFQDKLRRVVEETVQSANSANVKLPADFYMGFEQYRSTPPEAAAAPVLSRQLDAVQDLLKILIQRHVDALTFIKRAPLPQESNSAALASSNNNQAARPGSVGKQPAAPADSVSRQVVDIAFSGQPSVFRDTLDDLVTSKRLFLVRAVQVKNQKPKGPPRESGAAGPPPPGAAVPPAGPGGVPDPNAPPVPAADKPAFEYIVGQERLDVDMRVEIIRVAPPVAPATPAAR